MRNRNQPEYLVVERFEAGHKVADVKHLSAGHLSPVPDACGLTPASAEALAQKLNRSLPNYIAGDGEIG